MNTERTHGIRREFLGWDKPALPEAARRLAARYRQDNIFDLSRVIVVVPGQRAGRRLQELLAFLADEEHLIFTPPEVVTEGKLPEKLYTPKLPFASDVVQDLVWARALRDLPENQRRQVVPQPPDTSDLVRWLELGRVVRRLHTELAADGLDFTAILTHGPKVANFNETARWQALVELQRHYLALLDRQLLWDIQTARLEAIKRREIQTECNIILLGTVDLNDSLRQMLDQVADRVTAYIVAPADLADHFDIHGCLVPAVWCDAHLPLPDERLQQVGGSEEQADAVTDWLAKIGDRYRTDEVVIGVPDESLVPQLQRQLEQCHVAARWVEGVRLAETLPYRLLAAAVKFAGRQRYEDLAALVRHPDVEDWLAHHKHTSIRAGSLPTQLDQFYNTHLPSIVRADSMFRHDEAWPDLLPAVKHLEHWLTAASQENTLRAWGAIFRQILGEVYGGRTLELEKSSADDALHRTLQKILKECDRLSEVPAAIDATPILAADAFRIAFRALGDEFLPPPADPSAVEILGWLELPLDDAPALVVTSFNDGFVPKSAGADAFLPDRLRRELKLLHNDRRYARDAYAASVLCHSRKDLHVLFARRDTKKDPLQPSRLLFACDDDARLVARARKYFSPPEEVTSPRRLLLAPEDKIPERSNFEVPRPEIWDGKLERISVTRFKAYLACPYRYYLRHVRKLEAVDDVARELGGDLFGTLLHRVLGAFGRAPADLRDNDRAQRIHEFLAEELATQAAKLFGASQRRAAIQLQLEQARLRLGAFASQQAQLVRAGWRIVHAEDNAAELVRVDFSVDGQKLDLIGRIDRIDYHESSKTLRILDYKTADTRQTPEKTHRSNDEWIDLQLPLYRHLWEGLNLKVETNREIELGYFNLPKQFDQAAVDLAEWDTETLKGATVKAEEVIRKLRGEDGFWPPVYNPLPDFSEDLAAICLDQWRAGPALSDDEGGLE